MAGSGDHQINQEGHAIRHNRRPDEYHKAARHGLGDVHPIEPPLDEEGGDEIYDGRYYEACHPARIAKIGNRVSSTRRMSKSAHLQHGSGRYMLEQLTTAVTPSVC